MNGTNFFLAVNFIVAMSFCAVFIVVSTQSRSRVAALWIAAGFAVASLSTFSELLVAHTDWEKLPAISAFASLLGGLLLLHIGISTLYGRPVRKILAIVYFAGWCVVDMVIYDLPRGTASHAFTYQAPFALLAVSASISVMRSKRKLLIDRALALLLLLTAVHFVSKAVLAIWVGAGKTAKDYITTDYALISQSATGVMVVAAGLMLLSVLVLEIMTDERTNAQVDILSSLYNRRGFETKVASLLQDYPQDCHCVIVCDLDRFKTINDTHGHHGGDAVICTVAQRFCADAPANAVIARLGGEEFALFLPATDLDDAVNLAERLRSALAMQAVAELPADFRVTASFGVAELGAGVDLTAAMRNADRALYEAKEAGRNRVSFDGPLRRLISSVPAVAARNL